MRNKERAPDTPEKAAGTAAWAGAAIACLIVVAAAGVWWISGDGDSAVPALATTGSVPRGARRETRATLDPARFVGKAAVAHQVARDIPDVLDQLYCYCACDKSRGHQSLLSCYTDGHAAT